jgi:hypothetical protein
MFIVFSISIFLLITGLTISYRSSYLCITFTYCPFLYFILPSNSKMMCSRSFGTFILISYHDITLCGTNPHRFVETVVFFKKCSMIFRSVLLLIDAPLNSTSLFARSFVEPLGEIRYLAASTFKSLLVSLFVRVFFLVAEARLRVIRGAIVLLERAF